MANLVSLPAGFLQCDSSPAVYSSRQTHPQPLIVITSNETKQMRKIERQMNSAIATGTDFKSGNTEVINFYNDAKELVITSVFLHGNLIAEIGETFIRLFDGGYQSVTTKSRLNAILQMHGERGDRVFSKDYKWFLQMNTAQGLTTVPFFSSMRIG